MDRPSNAVICHSGTCRLKGWERLFYAISFLWFPELTRSDFRSNLERRRTNGFGIRFLTSWIKIHFFRFLFFQTIFFSFWILYRNQLQSDFEIKTWDKNFQHRKRKKSFFHLKCSHTPHDGIFLIGQILMWTSNVKVQSKINYSKIGQKKRHLKSRRRTTGHDCKCIFLNEDRRVNSFAKHYLNSEKSCPSFFLIVLPFENQIALFKYSQTRL